MFWIGVTHNSIGRFYETQSFGGAANRPLPVQQSREWYRPNPTPPDMQWGPRNNVNMVNGRQFIVVAVSGGPYSGEYIAFSLPPDAMVK